LLLCLPAAYPTDSRFFDQAGGLCNKGAVLSVNPSATQTDAAFKANGANAVVASTTTSTSDSATSTGASGSATGSGSDSASASESAKPSGAEQLVAGGAYYFAIFAALWALV
jgi:hypothetical protein